MDRLCIPQLAESFSTLPSHIFIFISKWFEQLNFFYYWNSYRFRLCYKQQWKWIKCILVVFPWICADFAKNDKLEISENVASIIISTQGSGIRALFYARVEYMSVSRTCGKFRGFWWLEPRAQYLDETSFTKKGRSYQSFWERAESAFFYAKVQKRQSIQKTNKAKDEAEALRKTKRRLSS